MAGSGERRIVIIGAGPTGLGAAWRLHERGYQNWAIYEQNAYVGGLSASFQDPQGFTWDIGGHVIFSKKPYFNDLIDRLLNGEYLEHMRESWIWVCDRFVPYPFQNNIRYLPVEAMIECLIGLVTASRNEDRAVNFEEWIVTRFGRGIAEYFMYPHNRKVWAHPLTTMSKNWIADRVSIVEPHRVLENILCKRDDVNWGPNNTFKFPLEGGTGGLFTRLVPSIERHLAVNKKAVSIDTEKRRIEFEDGTRDGYDVLITTAPLDLFVQSIRDVRGDILEAASSLIHTGGLMVGVGLRGNLESKKCWMYFPEETVPFYRITYFSNYSPRNTPGEGYYSIMCETSYSELKKEDKTTIVDRTIQGLIDAKILKEEDRGNIVSTYHIDIPYSYPVPTLDRDELLDRVQPFLEGGEIYSRGRFGGWKYECGNMDHSVMQGVQTVDQILKGGSS